MRFLFLSIALVFILTGCEQPAKVDHKKDYPKAQTHLMALITRTDSIIGVQNNDLGKQAVIDSANTQLQQMVQKGIDLKIDKWVGYVDEVKESIWGGADMFKVEVVIPLDDNFNKSEIPLHAIKLNCRFKKDDLKIADIARQLKKMDKVTVSGKFVVETTGIVSLKDMGLSPDAQSFFAPQMEMNLEAISKR